MIQIRKQIMAEIISRSWSKYVSSNKVYLIPNKLHKPPFIMQS